MAFALEWFQTSIMAEDDKSGAVVPKASGLTFRCLSELALVEELVSVEFERGVDPKC